MKQIVLIDFDEKLILIRDNDGNALQEIRIDAEGYPKGGERRPCIRVDLINNKGYRSTYPMTSQEAENFKQHILLEQKNKRDEVLDAEILQAKNDLLDKKKY